MAEKPLDGRIALVTGASRGIGRATALALAAAGAQVIATARTQGGLESLDDEIRALGGLRPTLAPLDLADAEGLDPVGYAIHQRFGRLDVLVHAAALLGVLTPVSHIEPKLWEQVMAVNMTATFRLLRTTEPLLRASPSGRAIYLTTGRVQRPKAFWGVYGATKAGAEHLFRTWADELANTTVRGVLVDPDVMRTRMRAEAMPGEDPSTLPDPSEIGPLMVELAAADLAPGATSVDFSAWRAKAQPVSA